MPVRESVANIARRVTVRVCKSLILRCGRQPRPAAALYPERADAVDAKRTPYVGL